MATASLSIPIAFWSNGCPETSITAVLSCRQFLVTGTQDGLLWIFENTADPTETVTLKYRTILVGHTSAITALTSLEAGGEARASAEWVVLSASEDGEVRKWSLLDGRCLQSNAKAYFGAPTFLHPFSSEHSTTAGPNFVFCAGMANEVCILDASTLDVIRVWGGHNNWIYCTPLPDSGSHRCRILSVSVEGKMDMWIFDEARTAIVKSKSLRQGDGSQDSILGLVVCDYQPALAVLFSKKSAKIIHLSSGGDKDFVIEYPDGDRIVGAKFLDKAGTLILWTSQGNSIVYTVHSPEDGSNDSITAKVIAKISLPLPENAITSLTVLHDRGDNLDSKHLVVFRNTTNGPVLYSSKLSQASVDMQDSGCNISDIWPPSPTSPQTQHSITASIMVGEGVMALGQEDGKILLGDVSDMLTKLCNGFLPENPGVASGHTLEGHKGAVTCFYVSDDLLERSFLLSGGADCTCRVWNTSSGIEIASFSNHTQPVTSFLQMPDGISSRLRRSIISVAEDNSIAIISIEEMSCIYLFGGYAHPLLSIQWRPSEDYMILWYSDKTAFIWQIQTAHLDRIVRGEAAQEIINDSQWAMSVVSDSSLPSSKRCIDCATIAINGKHHAGVQVAILNVRTLLNQLALFRSSESATSPQGAKSPPGIPGIPLSKARRSRTASSQSTASDPKNAPFKPTISANSSNYQSSLGIAKDTLRILLQGQDAGGTDLAAGFDLLPLNTLVTVGLRGTQGGISMPLPIHTKPGDVWCISSTMTASRLITIVALVGAISRLDSTFPDPEVWCRSFCASLPLTVGSDFCPPSLSYLVKYWQDPQSDIQESTKIILTSTMDQLVKEDMSSFLAFWTSFLPAAALPEAWSNQHMARSAIILGILEVEHRGALPESTCKLVALSLTILLNDDLRVSYKVAAIDLLAQGFVSWQPFIRADAVLKTLFSMAADAQLGNGTVSRRARRAVILIAKSNPLMFVATLTQDLVDTKLSADKIANLRLVSMFARKEASVLYNGIPKLLEAIVKSLDPNVPSMRESLQPVGTSVMLELVQAFPQIDFHVGSQKLAVGTLEGAIIVYDLQTATRWQILEGHTTPVTAVSFSSDGKTIVSCSVKDRTVRFWHPNPGFFGMLAGGHGLFGGGKSAARIGGGSGLDKSSNLPSLSSQQSNRTFEFAVQDSALLDTADPSMLLGHIKFEWSGDRVVKLCVYDHLMSFNV